MKRKTIASLEEELEDARNAAKCDRDMLRFRETELSETKKRLTAIAAENESLRVDIRWFKSLVQSLVPHAKSI